jgi:hypothetical protein
MNEKLDELIKKQNTKTAESVEEVNETSEEWFLPCSWY